MNNNLEDFIMTYGWAILVVTMAVGALFYFNAWPSFDVEVVESESFDVVFLNESMFPQVCGFDCGDIVFNVTFNFDFDLDRSVLPFKPSAEGCKVVCIYEGDK